MGMDRNREIYGCKRSKEGDSHMNTEERQRETKTRKRKQYAKEGTSLTKISDNDMLQGSTVLNKEHPQLNKGFNHGRICLRAIYAVRGNLSSQGNSNDNH